MRERRNPWKWPVCVGLAFGVWLGAAFLTPRRWLEFLLPSAVCEPATARAHPRGWLVLHPPPTVESVPERPSIPPPADQSPPIRAEDPRWWSSAWNVRVGDLVTGDLRATPDDSVRVALALLGLDDDVMAAVRPDSLLAARLHLLRIEDALRFDDLKPYLQAMTRARSYADLMSRAAAMYDDFLAREIQVPD